MTGEPEQIAAKEFAEAIHNRQRMAYNQGVDHCIRIVELYRKHNSIQTKQYHGSELIPDTFFTHMIASLTEIKQNG